MTDKALNAPILSDVPAPAHPAQPVMTLPNGRAVKPWLVLVSIIFGFFMSLLDATITNIALTDIQTNLNTNLTTVSWVINAYILTFTALLVTMGRVADQFGRKRVFMVGMVVFSIGSLLCALAPSIELLIAFRVLQGLGASVLEAVSLAIILAAFPRSQRTAAIGIWGALAGLASAVGPVLGGALLEVGRGNLEWRWIFFINLPFCLIGLLLIARNVPESRDTSATKRIDVGGVITLTVGIFCVALGFTQANDWGWGSWGVLALFAMAIVALGLFYVVETHQAQPILDFKLFAVRSFTAACMVGIMFTIAFEGVVVILTQYFIVAQGKTPLEAALAIIWMPLAAFVAAAGSGSAGDKLNPRLLIIAGMSLLGVGLLTLYALPVDASYLDTLWREVIIGIGVGLLFTSLPNVALSQVPRTKLGAGSGAYNTFQELGFALGVAILIGLLSGQFTTNLHDAQTRAITAVNAAQDVPAQVKTDIIAGLQRGNTPNNATPPTNIAAPAPDSTLNRQISAEFKRGTLDSFTFVWFAAAMFALFGIFPAFFTQAPKEIIDPHEAEFDMPAPAA